MPVSSVIRAQTIAGSPQIINTYVGGIFTVYNYDNSKSNRFISLKPTGERNESFNPEGNYFSGATTATSVNSIAVQPDGKIIVGGNFSAYVRGNTTSYCSNLVRLNTDGSLDAIYSGTSSGFNGEILTVAVDYSGRTVVGGKFTSFDGTSYGRMMRFSSDTTVDSTFTNPAFNDDVNVIVSTPYHKIGTYGYDYTYLVGGKFLGLMKELYYSGGTTPNTSLYFNTFTGTSVNTITLNTNTLFPEEIITGTTVYVGGDFTKYQSNDSNFNNIISMELGTGKQKTIFIGSSNGFNRPVRSIVVTPNNLLLVGGEFATFSGQSSDYFIILNSDGTANVRGYDFNGYVNKIELDCCGKFLVGGEFTSVFSTTVNYITRFKPDGGQLDRTFEPGNVGTLGFNNFVKTIYYSKS